MARPKSTPIAPVTDARRNKAPETGPESAGQSGDLQGLPPNQFENESVRELVEEGQYFEASVVDAVENAPEDGRPLRVHRRPEDDLPPEYADQPNDEPKE